MHRLLSRLCAVVCAAILVWNSAPALAAFPSQPARTASAQTLVTTEALSPALLRIRQPLSRGAQRANHWVVQELRHWQWRKGTPMLMLTSALGAVVHVVNHWASLYRPVAQSIPHSIYDLMTLTWYSTAIPLVVYVAGRAFFKPVISALIGERPSSLRQKPLPPPAGSQPVPIRWTWVDYRDWILAIGSGAVYALTYFKVIQTSPTVFVSAYAAIIPVILFLSPWILKRFRGPEWKVHQKRNNLFFAFMLSATVIEVIAGVQNIHSLAAGIQGVSLIFWGSAWILFQKNLVSVRGREHQMDPISFTTAASVFNALAITVYAYVGSVKEWAPWTVFAHADPLLLTVFAGLGALNIFRFVKSTQRLWPRSLSTSSPSLFFTLPAQVIFVTIATHWGIISERLSWINWIGLVPLIPGLWLGLFEREDVLIEPLTLIGPPREPFDQVNLWISRFYKSKNAVIKKAMDPELNGPLRQVLEPAMNKEEFERRMNEWQPTLASLGPLWDGLRDVTSDEVIGDDGTRRIKYFPKVPRQGSIDRGVEPYQAWTVADHTALMVWIAEYLAHELGATDEQSQRIIWAVFWHDVTEVITKDTTPMKNPWIWAFNKLMKRIIERIIMPWVFWKLLKTERPFWRTVHHDLTHDPLVKMIVKDSDKIAGPGELLMMAQYYPRLKHEFLEDQSNPHYTQWDYSHARLTSEPAKKLFKELVKVRDTMWTSDPRVSEIENKPRTRSYFSWIRYFKFSIRIYTTDHLLANFERRAA